MNLYCFCLLHTRITIIKIDQEIDQAQTNNSDDTDIGQNVAPKVAPNGADAKARSLLQIAELIQNI